MTLLIDLGNSRVKWARLIGGHLQEATAAPYAKIASGQAIVKACGHWTPSRIIGVSVASAEVREQLEVTLCRHWGCAVEWYGASAIAGGVRNAYACPERLGADRWAALIAANARFPNGSLVLDAGTAITVDVLKPGGVHQGGVIFPGSGLLYPVLGGGTAQVGARSASQWEALDRLERLREKGGTWPITDTAQAVNWGVGIGVMGAVRALLEAAATAAPDHAAWVATGGGVAPLLAAVEKPWHHLPNLVLEGVAVLGEIEPS